MSDEADGYYRRQNIRQRRQRIRVKPRTIPANATIANMPSQRIEAPLNAVTCWRENNQAGSRIDIFVGGTTRTASGIAAKPTRTSIGNLAAGDLLQVRVVTGFTGTEIIRFFGRDGNEIGWTRISAGN